MVYQMVLKEQPITRVLVLSKNKPVNSAGFR